WCGQTHCGVLRGPSQEVAVRLVPHRGYATICRPRTATSQRPTLGKEQDPSRRFQRCLLSGLAKGRGKIEIADREVVAEDIWPDQPVFQYAKGGAELLEIRARSLLDQAPPFTGPLRCSRCRVQSHWLPTGSIDRQARDPWRLPATTARPHRSRRDTCSSRETLRGRSHHPPSSEYVRWD